MAVDRCFATPVIACLGGDRMRQRLVLVVVTPMSGMVGKCPIHDIFCQDNIGSVILDYRLRKT